MQILGLQICAMKGSYREFSRCYSVMKVL